MSGRRSFLKFIRTAVISNDPRGDFIGDAREDRELPDAETWEQLESYLFGCHACDGAFEAAKEVWDEFKGRKASGFQLRRL
jgi:hypothetical protein